LPFSQLPDYNGGQNYDPFDAYAVSKLCNVMFPYELQRRLDKHEIGMTANAVHPVITFFKFFQSDLQPIP